MSPRCFFKEGAAKNWGKSTILQENEKIQEIETPCSKLIKYNFKMKQLKIMTHYPWINLLFLIGVSY